MELLIERFETIVEFVLLGLYISLVWQVRQLQGRQTRHEDQCLERQKVIHGKIDILMKEVSEITGILHRRER